MYTKNKKNDDMNLKDMEESVLNNSTTSAKATSRFFNYEDQDYKLKKHNNINKNSVKNNKDFMLTSKINNLDNVSCISNIHYNNNDNNISILNEQFSNNITNYILNKSWNDLEMTYHKNSLNINNISLSLDNNFKFNISGEDDQVEPSILETSKLQYFSSNPKLLINEIRDSDIKAIKKIKKYSYNYNQTNKNTSTNVKRSKSNIELGKKQTVIINTNKQLVEMLNKLTEHKKKLENSNLCKNKSQNDTKIKDNKVNYIIETEVVIMNSDKLEILISEHFSIILDYIYDTVSPIVTELSDYYTSQRRALFSDIFCLSTNDTSIDYSNNDNHCDNRKNYFKLINCFLKEKEECFLCILYEVMVKLNISKDVLDNTINYYLNKDDSDQTIKDIKMKYYKIYNAEIKW